MPDTIVQLILAGISGGVVTALANLYLGKKKEVRGDFEAIIKTWAEDNQRLRLQEIENTNKIQTLQKDLVAIRAKLLMLESAHVDLPYPMWLKDLDGTMLSVNRAYEDMILKPLGFIASDYMGLTDSEIFGEEIGKEYRKNDMAVLNTKAVYDGPESVQVGPHIVETWRVIKYLRYAGGVPIGIAGLALPNKN